MKLILTIGFTIISLIGLSQWEKIVQGDDIHWHFSNIDFVNSDTGIVIGGLSEPPMATKYFIMTTHDGGENFDTTMYAPNTKSFFDLHFYNDTIAYILSKTCCNQRIEILKTIDAGSTWNTICDSVTSGGTNDYTMQFTSPNNGIITAPGWTFYTTDGGVNWARTNYYSGMRSSTKYGDTIGFADGALVVFSNDLFNTYDSVYFDTLGVYLNSASCISIYNSKIVVGGMGVDGQTYGYPGFNFGKIVRYNPINHKIIEIDFPNLSNISDIDVAGDRIYCLPWVSNVNDLIIMSDNGGETWHQSEIIEPNGFNESFSDIDFINDTIGFAINESRIYKTTNAGGPFGQQVYSVTVQGASSIHENNYSLELNIYPNPTDNLINVEAPINSNLELYNISGKLIKTYNQTASKTQIDVSSISSGVYILKVLNEAGSATRKVIIN